MKKIAIITLTKNANYGNVLQNIALQEALRGIGYEAETIINRSKSSLFLQEDKSIVKKGKNLAKFILNRNGYRDFRKRNKAFLKCCKDHVKYSHVYYEEGKFSGQIEYDYYITGSDQVWNPFFGMASDFELLGFAPAGRKLSYSASFGVSNINAISENEKERIAKRLSELNAVSVREESGKKLVEELTGKECKVHVDPTMLMTSDYWEKMCRKPCFNVPSGYILVYMLGQITDEYNSVIQELSQKKQAKVINALEGACRFIDPLQFIWLIQNAEAVCTDSFHASVFSILFHKEFHIFSRKDNHADQSSRFVSLLKTVGISEYGTIYDGRITENKIDWQTVDQNLDKERKRGREYLSANLL